MLNQKDKQAFSIVNRAKSFVHARNGLSIFIRTTHNAWIQLVVAVIAIIMGFHYAITSTEWMFLVLAIGFVLVTECVNTAFEFDIDLTSPQFHQLAKYVKDIAAGAVLLASITAIVIGLIIFLPKMFFFS